MVAHYLLYSAEWPGPVVVFLSGEDVLGFGARDRVFGDSASAANQIVRADIDVVSYTSVYQQGRHVSLFSTYIHMGDIFPMSKTLITTRDLYFLEERVR